jgi:hypothetical protein
MYTRTSLGYILSREEMQWGVYKGIKDGINRNKKKGG